MRRQLPLPVVRGLVRTVVRPVLGPRVPVPVQRWWLTTVQRPTPLPRGVTVTRGTLAGRAVEVLTPAAADRGRAVLLLHGGGFTVGGAGTHRAFAAHLAAAIGASVHLLDYRLAPEHPFPAALDDAVAAYRELLARGRSPSSVAVVGDSAGGWLTIAATLRLREDGDPLPAVLGLVSPWLDLGLPWRESRRDDMLRPAWLRRCATLFAAGQDPARGPFAVLDADLSGLPPIAGQVGAQEILLGDSVRLARRVRAHRGRIELRQFDRLWHVASASAGLKREATESVAALGESLLRLWPSQERSTAGAAGPAGAGPSA